MQLFIGWFVYLELAIDESGTLRAFGRFAGCGDGTSLAKEMLALGHDDRLCVWLVADEAGLRRTSWFNYSHYWLFLDKELVLVRLDISLGLPLLFEFPATLVIPTIMHKLAAIPESTKARLVVILTKVDGVVKPAGRADVSGGPDGPGRAVLVRGRIGFGRVTDLDVRAVPGLALVGLVGQVGSCHFGSGGLDLGLTLGSVVPVQWSCVLGCIGTDLLGLQFLAGSGLVENIQLAQITCLC